MSSGVEGGHGRATLRSRRWRPRPEASETPHSRPPSARAPPPPHTDRAGRGPLALASQDQAEPAQACCLPGRRGLAGLFLVALGFVSGPIPGPGGIPLILLGLAVWSSEFEWAHQLMRWFKKELHRYRAWSAAKKVAVLGGLLRLLWTYRLSVPAADRRPRPGCPDLSTCSAAAARALTALDRPLVALERGCQSRRAAPTRVHNEPMRADDYAFFDAPFAAFAHRGGATYEPNLHRENSLHAFKQAVALGYRYLETDVHATRDGVLLAFHDRVLDRVTDRTGAIAELTYAEIAEARIHGLDPIPRLSELLAEFPDARFNIDAKSTGAVDLLAATIAEHEAYDRVCVGSFGIRRLHRLRRRLGCRVPSAASALGVAANRFVPW